MQRRIYITEEQQNKILSSIELPEHLLADVDAHKTSLGDNSALPPLDGITYEHLAAKKRYEELKNKFAQDLSVDEKMKMLSEITSEIQKREAGNEATLEKLCFNIVNGLFSIPAGIVTFRCHLMPNLSSKSRVVRAKSEDDPNMEFDSVAEMQEAREEVAKRRMINALVMGASLRYCKIPKCYIGDIYEIDPQLPKLYTDFDLLNNLLVFEMPLPEITDDEKLQGGFSEVTLGNQGERSTVETYATTFPILLSESVRGFMELFASHGLPEDKRLASFVVKKADFAAAEPWDMRIGPTMWKTITDTIGKLDTRCLPLLFTKIASLEPRKFNGVMSEILAGTRTGKDLLRSIADDVSSELEYDDFEDQLRQKDMQKNMITDGYISPDEL